MTKNQLNWNIDISTSTPTEDKLAKTKDAAAVLIQTIIEAGNALHRPS